jgi:hypothetical protein
MRLYSVLVNHLPVAFTLILTDSSVLRNCTSCLITSISIPESLVVDQMRDISCRHIHIVAATGIKMKNYLNICDK